MRIIGGQFKGRKLLDCFKHKELRPTTDFNRETLFNLLQNAKFLHEIAFKLNQSLFIDICCGSGSVAIEAISRGANEILLIDNNDEHLAIARKNIEKLNLELRSTILKNDARKIKSLKTNHNFNNDWTVIFCDPPYDFNYHSIFQNLFEKDLITPKTLIICEFSDDKLDKFSNFFPNQFKELALKKNGKTFFGFYQKIFSNFINL